MLILRFGHGLDTGRLNMVAVAGDTNGPNWLGQPNIIIISLKCSQ